MPRKLTDLEAANLAFRSGKVLEDAKALLKEDMTHVTSPSLTPEQLEEERVIQECLTGQLAAGWELVKEEAEEALKVNSDDDHAKTQLLHYAQWKRQQKVPEAIKKKSSGLTITKGQRCKGQRNIGVWQRTRDFGWLMKVSGKGNVGDVINVRRKGGETIPMELTEEVAPCYFRAREI